MRYLIILVVLVSCIKLNDTSVKNELPLFKIGDCIALKDDVGEYDKLTQWEKELLHPYIITNIGTRSYQVQLFETRNMYFKKDFSDIKYYTQVPCPKI